LIEVTPTAAEKLGGILKEKGEEGSLLRVMVSPGPNGGVQYMLGVEKEAKEDDFVVSTDTIQVLIDQESAPLIEGAQIDYVEGLMRSGFVISNPNLQGQGGCACGGSGGGCGGGGGGGESESEGGGGGCGCGGGGGGCGCGGGGGGCGGGGGGCGGH
jgi:iron-sulfur cluster assembly accessory protein